MTDADATQEFEQDDPIVLRMEYEAKLRTIREELERAMQDASKNKEELATAKSRVSELEWYVEGQQEETAKYIERAKRLEDELREIRSKLPKLEKERDEFEKKLDAIRAEKDQEKQDAVAALEERIDALKSELDGAVKDGIDASTHAAVVAERDQLQARVTELNDEMAATMAAIKTQVQQLAESQASQAEYEEKLAAAVESVRSEYEKKIATAESDREHAVRESVEAMESLKTQKEQEKQDAVTALEERIAALKSELDGAVKDGIDASTHAAIVAERDQLQARVTELNDEMAATMAAIKTQVQQLAESQASQAEYEEKLSAAVESVRSEYEKKIEDANEAAGGKVDAVRAEGERAVEAVKAEYEEKLQAVREEKDRVAAESAQSRAELAIAQSRTAALKSELDGAVKDGIDVSTHAAIVAERDQLQARVTELNDDIAGAMKRIESQVHQLAESQASQAEYEEKLAAVRLEYEKKIADANEDAGGKVDAVRAEGERAVEAVKAEYEEKLAAVREEKDRVAAESAQSRAELAIAQSRVAELGRTVERQRDDLAKEAGRVKRLESELSTVRETAARQVDSLREENEKKLAAAANELERVTRELGDKLSELEASKTAEMHEALRVQQQKFDDQSAIAQANFEAEKDRAALQHKNEIDEWREKYNGTYTQIKELQNRLANISKLEGDKVKELRKENDALTAMLDKEKDAHRKDVVMLSRQVKEIGVTVDLFDVIDGEPDFDDTLQSLEAKLKSNPVAPFLKTFLESDKSAYNQSLDLMAKNKLDVGGWVTLQKALAGLERVKKIISSS